MSSPDFGGAGEEPLSSEGWAAGILGRGGIDAVVLLSADGFAAPGVLSSGDLPMAGCSLPQLLQKRALAGSITEQFTHFLACPATPPLGCL